MFKASENPLFDLPAYCEQDNVIGSLANAAALLYEFCHDINWLGFYLYDGKVLRLGPFQGKPACTLIALGKGVCGTAAANRETIVVDDVRQFPGHIVCDSASLSEIVVPIYQDGVLCGVLDVDSALLARFTEEDKKFFKRAVEVLTENLDFSKYKFQQE